MKNIYSIDKKAEMYIKGIQDFRIAYFLSTKNPIYFQ